ncbi:MAG TPA: glycosyltransferase family 39 protein [Xanthobacteraceae bacterium]|jgi:4-amino-4-deoxy-L-arabinose transferase-like glycosyltransferase
MERTIAGHKPANWGAGIVAAAMHAPRRVLACLLGVHLVVWTVLPILVCPNLQIDLVEGLALGKEWQLGYWKHPPLPWWIDEITYRLTGQIDSVYVLGPLASIICLYGVWLLAREVVDEITALIAVVVLEGIHFYNFSAVKFAHDQIQLPFWAFTGLFFYHAVKYGRLLNWVLSGIFLAGAFWSKYAAFVLAATLGLFLLFDPLGRKRWRTAGPYLMTTVFVLVLAPNLWWLVGHDFLPFRYVDQRAPEVAHWYQYFTFPVVWIANNIFTLSPAIALLAILFWGKPFPIPLNLLHRARCSLDFILRRRAFWRAVSKDEATGRVPPSWFETRTQRARAPHHEGEVGPAPRDGEVAAFNRRYVTALALGPFLLTTAIAIGLGRSPQAMWAYPLWSFAPLAALMWLRPAANFGELRAFAVASVAVLLAFPVAYAVTELFESFIHDRPKATEFPGRLLAGIITQKWHETTGEPLVYVGGAEFGTGAGGEFPANLVAVYSADHPHVIVHGDSDLSPWIDVADVRRRGAVLIWDWGWSAGIPENLKSVFPDAELQPGLMLPRQTLYPRSPALVKYAFVRPRVLALRSPSNAPQ